MVINFVLNWMFEDFYVFFCVLVGIIGIVSIDSNGDRNVDYLFLDMDFYIGKFEVCILNLI